MTSIIKVDQIQNSSGTVPTAGDLGLNVSGNTIQIVQSGTLADFSSSSTDWIDTNMTLNITPTSTSSKVLVNFTVVQRVDGTGSIMRGGYRITRTVGGVTTTVYNTAGGVEHIQVRNAAGEISGIGGYLYLDSPSTTSPVTYTLQAKKQGDSGTNWIRARASNLGANVILTEIAG